MEQAHSHALAEGEAGTEELQVSASSSDGKGPGTWILFSSTTPGPLWLPSLPGSDPQDSAGSLVTESGLQKGSWLFGYHFTSLTLLSAFLSCTLFP